MLIVLDSVIERGYQSLGRSFQVKKLEDGQETLLHAFLGDIVGKAEVVAEAYRAAVIEAQKLDCPLENRLNPERIIRYSPADLQLTVVARAEQQDAPAPGEPPKDSRARVEQREGQVAIVVASDPSRYIFLIFMGIVCMALMALAWFSLAEHNDPSQRYVATFFPLLCLPFLFLGGAEARKTRGQRCLTLDGESVAVSFASVPKDNGRMPLAELRELLIWTSGLILVGEKTTLEFPCEESTSAWIKANLQHHLASKPVTTAGSP